MDNNNESETFIKKEDKETITDKKETIDEGIQLNLKDLYSNQGNVNFDENKCAEFLKRAYVYIEDALENQEKYLYLLDEKEEIDKEDFTWKSILQFTTKSLSNADTEIIKLEKKKFISDVIWNHGGNKLMIAYSEEGHIGPCCHEGIIKIFEFNNFNFEEDEKDYLSGQLDSNKNKNSHSLINSHIKPIIILETNSCIKCLDSHPNISNIFIAGGYNGQIYYINIGKENKKDCIEYISKIDSTFYKECVINVKFIKFEENTYYIISISEDGRILLWNIDNKLKYPVIGYSLRFSIEHKSMFINPTILEINPFQSFDYKIGTYDGNIYRCYFNKPNDDAGASHEHIFSEKKGVVWRNEVKIFLSEMKDKEIIELKSLVENICLDKKIANLTMEEFLKLRPDIKKIYKNCLKSNYEKCYSPIISLNMNTFIKNLFLVTSFDGNLRLYYGEETKLKYFYSQYCENDKRNNITNYYTCSVWSPYKPSIIVSGKSNGDIEFSLLTNKKNLYSLGNIENSGHLGVTKILFNPNESRNRNILTVVYKDGIIEMYKLSESFSQVGINEIENIIKTVSN